MHCKKIALVIVVSTGLASSNENDKDLLPVIQRVWDVSSHYENIDKITIRIIRFKVEKEGWKTFDQILWKKKESDFYNTLVPNIDSINEFIGAAGNIFESEEKRNDFLRLVSILYCGDVGRVANVENKIDNASNNIITAKFKSADKEFDITLFFGNGAFMDRVEIKKINP